MVPKDVSSRKHLCGRKKKDYSLQLANLSTIPLQQRTLRSTAEASGIPKTTLISRMKDGELRSHSNAIKPFLTTENTKSRVEFCHLHLNLNRGYFNDTFDVVHIDEKWFYITENATKFYLGKDEPDPLRTTKSKRFTKKVMFLAAVSRPRWDPHRKCYFDGKLRIWPFVTKEKAQHNSRNRPAGIMVTKVMTFVTKDNIHNSLIEKVLVAILEKFPRTSHRNTIKIQQDNARPHIHSTDPLFKEASEKLGLNIEIVNQSRPECT